MPEQEAKALKDTSDAWQQKFAFTENFNEDQCKQVSFHLLLSDLKHALSHVRTHSAGNTDLSAVYYTQSTNIMKFLALQEIFVPILLLGLHGTPVRNINNALFILHYSVKQTPDMLYVMQIKSLESKCKEARDELKEARDEVDRLQALMVDMVPRAELNASRKVCLCIFTQ